MFGGPGRCDAPLGPERLRGHPSPSSTPAPRHGRLLEAEAGLSPGRARKGCEPAGGCSGARGCARLSAGRARGWDPWSWDTVVSRGEGGKARSRFGRSSPFPPKAEAGDAEAGWVFSLSAEIASLALQRAPGCCWHISPRAPEWGEGRGGGERERERAKEHFHSILFLPLDPCEVGANFMPAWDKSYYPPPQVSRLPYLEIGSSQTSSVQMRSYSSGCVLNPMTGVLIGRGDDRHMERTP